MSIKWNHDGTWRPAGEHYINVIDRCAPPVTAGHTSLCGALDVTVDNTTGDQDFAVVITTDAGHVEPFSLPAGDTTTIGFAPGLSYEVFVERRLIASGAWEDPGDCDPSRIPIEGVSTCDSLIVTVTNPSTFRQDMFVNVSGGGLPDRSHEVGPGASDAEVAFDAAEGTVATVVMDGDTLATIAWEEPDNCDEAGNGTAGEELAATGSPTLWIAGVAAVLLVLGGGLTFLARRGGVNFTA